MNVLSPRLGNLHRHSGIPAASVALSLPLQPTTPDTSTDTFLRTPGPVAPKFCGDDIPEPTPVMNKFINLKNYAIYEQQHAGWVLSNAIKAHILTHGETHPDIGLSMANPNILEIGCSSGTSTIPLVKELCRHDQKLGTAFQHYDAIDIDPEAIQILNMQLNELAQGVNDNNPESLAKVRALVADAMRHTPEPGKRYTHAVMQFALSHFDQKGKTYLLDHLVNTLNLSPVITHKPYGAPLYREEMDLPLDRKGYILITDEFLPGYGDDGKKEPAALWKHHGAVIFDALTKGNFELAELELEAFYSGLHKIGDFKVPCKDFESMLFRRGLTFRKFKTFPLKDDMIPFDSEKPPCRLSKGHKTANEIWQAHHREIFEAASRCKPTAENMAVPEEPRQKLRELIEKFKAAGVTNLRKTPKPGEIEVTDEALKTMAREERKRLGEAEADQWGVYTYQISKSQKYDRLPDRETLGHPFQIEPEPQFSKSARPRYTDLQGTPDW